MIAIFSARTSLLLLFAILLGSADRCDSCAFQTHVGSSGVAVYPSDGRTAFLFLFFYCNLSAVINP